MQRVHEIIRNQADLAAADLSNRATHDGDHDQWPVARLVERFERDLERSARRPRLGTPMRLIDLAYFVAQHDDHHLARLRE